MSHNIDYYVNISLSYCMDRGSHVNMKPDSGIVEAKIGPDEESGTGGRCVAPIGHRVFHVRHSRGKLGEVKLPKKYFDISRLASTLVHTIDINTHLGAVHHGE